MTQISVIIPTYNRLEQLKLVIAGLEKQTCPLDTLEVIIISDGSTDGTNPYLTSLQTPLNLIPLLETGNRGVAAARNRGIAQACGQIILFLDDDTVPTPQLVAEHVWLHRLKGDDVVVLGPMFSPPDFKAAPWAQWEQAMLFKQYRAIITGRWKPSARQFYTSNASIGRHHLLAVGGFDTNFRRAEDVELAYRLAARNLQFLFNPAAIGYHYAIRSYASWAAIAYTYGQNDVIFSRDKGQTWLLPAIFAEFHTRHPLVKTLAYLCLGRPRLAKFCDLFLKLLADNGYRQDLPRVYLAAYSAIFNLRYYQGLVDELGGRAQFFANLAMLSEGVKKKHA